MSHVMCHVSHVTCHMSHCGGEAYWWIEQTELMKSSQEEGQAFYLFDIVGYSLINWWRVCYQQGQPRLVLAL